MALKKYIRAWLGIDAAPITEPKPTNPRAALTALRNATLPRNNDATRILAPYIVPGVVPEGETAQVTLDSNPCYNLPINQLVGTGIYMPNGFIPFPGFQFLASLMTRVEYRNLAETLADEVTREWIEFVSNDAKAETNDKIKMIENEFIRLDVKTIIHRAVIHDAEYGRAQLYFDFDGYAGADPALPLTLDPRSIPIGSFKGVRTVEAMWSTPSFYNAVNPVDEDFYKPSTWFMLGIEVHSSRLMTIVTRELPDILKPAYNFAGMSLSQLCEGYIVNWLNIRQSVTDIVRMFSTTGLGTQMQDVLNGSDYGNATNLVTRTDIFVNERNNRGVLLFDKETEELVQLNAPLTNLDKLQSQGIEHICTAARTPAVKYTGLSPTGLNASSEGELAAYRDSIHGIQEGYWLRPITQILKIVQLSLFGEIDPSISVKFRSLHQINDKDKAQIRASDTTRDTSYVAAGIISQLEVRERLANDPDSGYDNLVPEELPKPLDDNKDESSDKPKDESSDKPKDKADKGEK